MHGRHDDNWNTTRWENEKVRSLMDCPCQKQSFPFLVEGFVERTAGASASALACSFLLCLLVQVRKGTGGLASKELRRNAWGTLHAAALRRSCDWPNGSSSTPLAVLWDGARFRQNSKAVKPTSTTPLSTHISLRHLEVGLISCGNNRQQQAADRIS